MGGSHSRSEDLRKRPFFTSNNYIDSLQEVPGYFTRTQQTIDFLEEDLSSQPRIEMSYNGPPSHLQHSRDVHPFLDRFGPNFLPRERFVDRSHDDDDIPPSLLPAAESARELREIEVRETMASLKLQVKETLAKKRDQTSEVVKDSTADLSKIDLATDEQNTLEFLDSIINESMDIDLGEDDEVESESGSEANWIMRDKDKLPLPGLMHSTVPTVSEEQPVSPKQPSSRPSSGFFRNSMYLPDNDPIHSASRSKQTPPPTKPKPANRRSRVTSDDMPPRDYPSHSPVLPPPLLPVETPVDTSMDTPDAKERTESKNSSNTSAEDMGIVVDDVTSEEGSGKGDNDNQYDSKSRIKGVRALVSMYSDDAYSPTNKQGDFDFPATKDPFVGMQLPIRDYMFGNSNNSNGQRPSASKEEEDVKGQMYGTMSSEDSALGDGSRDPVEDVVLGVIHSELQKLRMK